MLQVFNATSQPYAYVVPSGFGNATARRLDNTAAVRVGKGATTQAERCTQITYTSDLTMCSAIRFGNAAATRLGNLQP